MSGDQINPQQFEVADGSNNTAWQQEFASNVWQEARLVPEVNAAFHRLDRDLDRFAQYFNANPHIQQQITEAFNRAGISLTNENGQLTLTLKSDNRSIKIPPGQNDPPNDPATIDAIRQAANNYRQSRRARA